MSAKGAAVPPARGWFFLGILAGLVLPLALGEAWARLRPPTDLIPYLGEAAGESGPFRPAPAVGAAYRSVADFRSADAARLASLAEARRGRPVWAWFGNSFVQAPGMLAETAQVMRPETQMFFLQRNEPLPVRVAQLEALLGNGLAPERVIFAILPIDALHLGRHSLSSIHVTRRGSISYRPRLPREPLATVIRSSRLASTAWIRSGRHPFDPAFDSRRVTSEVRPTLRSDLQTLLSALNRLAERHRVPATVLLIPNREQIFGTAGFAFQDEIVALCRTAGLDYVDVRHVFEGEKEKPQLFLPDWHFTPRGNGLVLSALLAHLEAERR